MLTRSFPVNTEYMQLDNLGDYVLRWAKVTITDGTDSVILTGKYDKGYFPPYIYTTGRMRGSAGKSYTLLVEYRNFKASATTFIPPPPANCSFKVQRCNDSGELYLIKVSFKDKPYEKNYYQFFTRVGTQTKQYLTSYLGSINDEMLNGTTELPVYRGRQLGDEDYTPYFHLGDTVSVKFAQVDETSYFIWNSYSQLLSLSSNMFLSTFSDVASNITGGYGYWCGYGAITNHLIIEVPVHNDK